MNFGREMNSIQINMLLQYLKYTKEINVARYEFKRLKDLEIGLDI